MCSAGASADTVINKSTVCLQSGLKYNSLCGKYLEIIHYITLHHIGSQDNNTFIFFPKGSKYTSWPSWAKSAVYDCLVYVGGGVWGLTFGDVVYRASLLSAVSAKCLKRAPPKDDCS